MSKKLDFPRKVFFYHLSIFMKWESTSNEGKEGGLLISKSFRQNFDS